MKEKRFRAYLTPSTTRTAIYALRLFDEDDVDYGTDSSASITVHNITEEDFEAAEELLAEVSICICIYKDIIS